MTPAPGRDDTMDAADVLAVTWPCGCIAVQRLVTACPAHAALAATPGRDNRGAAEPNVIDAVATEIVRQDAIHPSGFPPHRDGVRFALAAAQDELNESLDAWRAERCKCGTPLCGHADWTQTTTEAIQAAAILLRMVAATYGDAVTVCDSCHAAACWTTVPPPAEGPGAA